MLRLTLPALVAPLPALAQEHGYESDYGLISLQNTDFVVFLGFLVFVAILLYYKVPARVMGMLDKRSAGIRSELDEARTLREEAQSLLTSYERKQAEVDAQAQRIVASAREEAAAAAEQAKADLEATVARRMQGAEDQIASARAAAVQEVRNRAVEIAVAAAADVLSQQMTPERSRTLTDSSIDTVSSKLH